MVAQTPVADTPPARRYRGAAADDRRSQRRCQLIQAAIAVYGERGFRNATVKAVCEAAGLTERYFYESFDNSEALLLASYQAVMHALMTQLAAAGDAAGRARRARVRAMLRAYFDSLQRDPRSARVFLVEIRGVSAEVDRALDASLREFGRGLAHELAPGRAADDLLAAGVVGGVMHIALRWIADGHRPGIDAVTDTALKLCLTLGARPASRG